MAQGNPQAAIPNPNPQEQLNAIIPEDSPIITQLKVITHELSSQGTFNHIQAFDGSDPKKFRQWVKEISKYCTIVSADEDRKKRVTFGTSRGVVSSFIERFLRENPSSAYKDLISELTKQFSDVTDAHSALQLLRKIKQGKHESLQAFHERLVDVAEQAFDKANLATQAYQDQLVMCFTDGLHDNRVARYIIRQKPKDLKNALELAMNERNLLRQLDIRGKNESHGAPYTDQGFREGEEPMEIGAVKQIVCYRCNKPGHMKKDCRVRLPQTNRTTNNKRISCYACGRFGHKAINCRTRPTPPTQPRQPWYNPSNGFQGRTYGSYNLRARSEMYNPAINRMSQHQGN